MSIVDFEQTARMGSWSACCKTSLCWWNTQCEGRAIHYSRRVEFNRP